MYHILLLYTPLIFTVFVDETLFHSYCTLGTKDDGMYVMRVGAALHG